MYILDDDAAWETVSCNNCGTPHGELRPLPFVAGKEAVHYFQYGKWQFVECPKCRLRFYSPRLIQNTRCIAETLTNEASKKQADTLFEHGSFWEVPDKAKQIVLVKNFYGTYIRKAVDLLGREPLALYEIASSIGRLLSVAKEYYPACRLAGCEPNVHAARYCIEDFGIPDIAPTLFRDAPAVPESFDVVIGWNYIEHTYTPKEDIQKAFAMLRSGGVLMLRTFHEEGNQADGYQSGPIAHQYHFFQDVLMDMVRECGFVPTIEVTGRDFFVYGCKP